MGSIIMWLGFSIFVLGAILKVVFTKPNKSWATEDQQPRDRYDAIALGGLFIFFISMVKEYSHFRSVR